MDRMPPLREFLCSDATTREILREAREIVLLGDPTTAGPIRSELRRFGFRVRVIASADSLDPIAPVDVAVWLSLEGDFEAQLAAVRRANGNVVWLGRGVGDPTHAWAAHRAGFFVVFHRDIAEEYRMHFDDVELGYARPGAAREPR